MDNYIQPVMCNYCNISPWFCIPSSAYLITEKLKQSKPRWT